MYRQKIGISIGYSRSFSMKEYLEMLRGIGFEAVSPEWAGASALEETVTFARAAGLEIQSVHAPFGGTASLWSSDPDVSDHAKAEILETIETCGRLLVPIVVLHAWIGFAYQFDKASLYYGNFEEIVRVAKENGVRIAFENTEGEEYLFALMEHFADDGTVGFCWDSGHEMCYNDSKDLLALLGDRLIMTHLNDNLGVSRFDGKIFWTDDLHLLPYDGVADWEYNVARLKKAKRVPILNFELNMGSKPNRHDNDVYAQMSMELFYTEAYKRACRIAYRFVR